VLLAAVAVTGNGLLTSAVHAQDLSADPTTNATPAADRFRLPAIADLASDASRSLIDVPQDAGEGVDLNPVIAATADLVAAMPETDWDVATLAATLPDATSAFELVRDGIAFDAYRGVLRGDAGTLAARAGGSFDRAMLLKVLLDAQGATSRYAIGTLDSDTAAALVARSLSAPVAPLPAAGYSPIDDSLEMATELRARRDHALLLAALGDDLSGLDADATAAAIADVTRHAWVQVAQDDGTWLDLDPSLVDAAPGDTLTTPDETTDALAQTDMHMVRIRLAAEHLRSGALHEDWYLDTALPAWVLDDEQLILTFAPKGSGDGGLLGPGGLLGGGGGGGSTAWSPVLFVGSDAAYGTDIVFSGEVGGGGLLGPGEQVDLASLGIEVTTTSPDGGTRTVRQSLADRVSPELRAGGPLSPEQLAPVADVEGTPAMFRNVTHIMVSTGGANPRHQAVDLAFAAQMAAWGANTDDPGAILAVDAFQPGAALDRSLVMASERRFIPAIDDAEVRAFVAQPRITATTSSVDLADPSVASFRTDLMIDGVRTMARDGAPEDAAARRQLWYGALQGALETEFVLSGASLIDPAARVLASASFDTTRPLTVVTDAAQVPAAADASLALILAAGGRAVVPGDVKTATTWWEIGPDGSTRSVIAPRLGSGIKKGPLDPSSPLNRVQPKPESSPSGGHKQGRRGPGERGAVEQAVVPAAETTGKQVGYSNADKFVEAGTQLMKNGTKFPKI
jgi:transglutaminase-like putative cysteine protease